ncbi:MAG: glycoside hydrolase family 15 protein [Thermoplasmata archaeon]
MAFGGPGITPQWEHGDKSGVGTAYSTDSKVWYTLWRGIVTEVFYPTVDRPQLRDLQFLVTDGTSLFQEERRHLLPEISCLDPVAPAYRVTTTDPDGRYSIVKEVITAPHLPVLLERVRFQRDPGYVGPLGLYLLAAPHLDVGGSHNSAFVASVAGRSILMAEHNGVWLALGSSLPFDQLSVGYVGASDGWTDLARHFRMTWEFDQAPDGNVALTAALPDPGDREFTVAMAFGRGAPHAIASLLQALGTPYSEHRGRFLEQWGRTRQGILTFADASSDEGRLCRTSHSTILTHEDKTFPGGFIASLSIPWGNARDDDDRGGYHLVWTRDLCEIATGLLAAGNKERALRTLIYLAASQRDDGCFPQNFWITGEPYWAGIQLDEVAFPILLAWRLDQARGLGEFDPYPMVLGAARFLADFGPATAQERWEEAAGYSPSTLAVHISALVIAAEFARRHQDEATALFLEGSADFLENHLEGWTVTTRGTLVPGHPRHYVRILPIDLHDPTPSEDVNTAELVLANQPPGEVGRWPARDIVDGGFLELVRYGVRPADDPIIVESLQVIDRVLKVDTPFGPCWRRYTHDGYGQRSDGGPFVEWGVGRAWPLLTGERGHYELAAGRDPKPYLRAMERFASVTGLLPEQVWDQPSMPHRHLELGRPTGSAMPLVWAHAEYLKLLRSATDGKVYDHFTEVARRYAHPTGRPRPFLEVWKHRRQPASVPAGGRLRIQSPAMFRLHWSADGWRTTNDTPSTQTGLGLSYVDIGVDGPVGSQYVFTFFWPREDRWEGRDYSVTVRAPEPPRPHR